MKTGDILVYSYGYDATYVEFYQVVDTNGKSAILREIASKVVSDLATNLIPDNPAVKKGLIVRRLVAIKDEFIGDPFKKRIVITRNREHIKIGHHGSINVADNAYLWDGRPESYSDGY
jgi:hypothetical protein